MPRTMPHSHSPTSRPPYSLAVNPGLRLSRNPLAARHRYSR